MRAVHVGAPLPFETSRWPARHPPLHRGQTSVVSSCFIHVYMPNLVRPSVGPVWPNQSLDLAADFQAHPRLPRWLSQGLPSFGTFPSFLSSDVCKDVFNEPNVLVICFILRQGSVVKAIWLKSDVSCSSCHHLSPGVGGVGAVSRMMHVHRLPSLPAKQSGITTQSGWPLRHADNVPLSFVPLH